MAFNISIHIFHTFDIFFNWKISNHFDETNNFYAQNWICFTLIRYLNITTRKHPKTRHFNENLVKFHKKYTMSHEKQKKFLFWWDTDKLWRHLIWNFYAFFLNISVFSLYFQFCFDYIKNSPFKFTKTLKTIIISNTQTSQFTPRDWSRMQFSYIAHTKICWQKENLVVWKA